MLKAIEPGWTIYRGCSRKKKRGKGRVTKAIAKRKAGINVKK